MPNEVETTKRREALEAVRRFLEAPDNAENVKSVITVASLVNIWMPKLRRKTVGALRYRSRCARRRKAS